MCACVRCAPLVGLNLITVDPASRLGRVVATQTGAYVGESRAENFLGARIFTRQNIMHSRWNLSLTELRPQRDRLPASPTASEVGLSDHDSHERELDAVVAAEQS